MPRDSRFDILFEPVKIGPVTAPNRFYQVPHCTGMGYQLPATLAAMRGIKAEGGWGVVNTEYCSIHPSSDDIPHPFASLWDEGDVRNMAAMADAVHAHGAWPEPSCGMAASAPPTICRARWRWRRRAFPRRSRPGNARRWTWTTSAPSAAGTARRRCRAKQAGLDIVYVYAAHTYILNQFLDRDMNTRSDEYGGTLHAAGAAAARGAGRDARRHRRPLRHRACGSRSTTRMAAASRSARNCSRRWRRWSISST